MGNFSPRLLPRKILNARVITSSLDEDNLPLPPTVQNILLENCGVHPITGYKLMAMGEGFRDKRLWEVYTTTPLPYKVEGEGVSPPEIEVKPNIWAVVVGADEWEYTIQSHTKYVVVEKNER